MLAEYGFDEANTPIVHGSALCALEGREEELGKQSILKLLDLVDSWIPIPERHNDKPFLMPIETTYSIPGRGTVVSGKVERGSITPGTSVEIVGRKKVKTVVTGGCGLYGVQQMGVVLHRY